MDPLTIAAILTAISTIAGFANTGIDFSGNKALQEDAQTYNSLEAVLAREFQRKEAASARQFSHDEAVLAREFTERMDNTKYQRQIADMLAAGINPAMILGGVSSMNSSPMANTTSGSTAYAASSGASSFRSNFSHDITSGINSALQLTLSQNLKNDKFVKQFANNLSATTGKSLKNSPDWLSDYEKNFESGVVDL